MQSQSYAPHHKKQGKGLGLLLSYSIFLQQKKVGKKKNNSEVWIKERVDSLFYKIHDSLYFFQLFL